MRGKRVLNTLYAHGVCVASLREKFVELHSLPLMDYLRDDICQNLNRELPAKPAVDIPSPPPSGALDLQEVLESIYFFS